MEEVDFSDKFVESNTKLVENLEFVAKDIPNLVDVKIEVGFHDQLDEVDKEILQHLVMDDLVVGVLDSLVADVDEGFLLKHYV